MTTETDNTVIPQDTQDDFKGLVVESNGERLEESKPSDPVKDENPAPEVEQKPKRPGKVERENAKLKEELAAINARLAKVEQPADKPSEDTPPKEEDFENVLDYLKAERKYENEQLKKELKTEQTQELTKAQEQVIYQKKVDAFAEREAKIIEENPDYAEKVVELVEDGLINKPMLDAIMDSDVGEKITLYLTQKPDEAAMIAQLQGPQLYRVMGMLEARLSGEEKPVQRQTKASAPISPVRVNAASESDPSKMSQKEFEQWMKV